MARWNPADRAHFDTAGGFMRVGGRVAAATSFEAVYVHELSESGDPYFDRYAVGSGFVTLGNFGDFEDIDTFPLQLLAEEGQPVICSVVE